MYSHHKIIPATERDAEIILERNMAGSASQMQNIMGGYNMVSSNVDDLLAPSTVSMIILFGSIMFATAAMAARELLRGDRRGTSLILLELLLLFCSSFGCPHR